MNLNITANTKRILIAAVLFGLMALAPKHSLAASEGNPSLAQDWHIALPAELPPAQPEMASLDQ